MSSANKPAFPGSYTGNNGMPVWANGMTKLEYFAGLAMQGLCLTASPKYDKGECNAAIAERAVILARALLAELEKEVRA
jgi:hypothetical protein